jgi:hypothetical protein
MLAHLDTVGEAVLPVERPGLEGGYANLAVELRAPGLLVGLDEQPQPPALERVPGCRLPAAAPVRQVERKPALCELENQMGDRGFEPRTSALSERRSNQLS